MTAATFIEPTYSWHFAKRFLFDSILIRRQYARYLTSWKVPKSRVKKKKKRRKERILNTKINTAAQTLARNVQTGITNLFVPPRFSHRFRHRRDTVPRLRRSPIRSSFRCSFSFASASDVRYGFLKPPREFALEIPRRVSGQDLTANYAFKERRLIPATFRNSETSCDMELPVNIHRYIHRARGGSARLITLRSHCITARYMPAFNPEPLRETECEITRCLPLLSFPHISFIAECRCSVVCFTVAILRKEQVIVDYSSGLHCICSESGINKLSEFCNFSLTTFRRRITCFGFIIMKLSFSFHRFLAFVSMQRQICHELIQLNLFSCVYTHIILSQHWAVKVSDSGFTFTQMLAARILPREKSPGNCRTAIKNFRCNSLADGTFGGHVLALSTLRAIRNFYRTNLRLYGGGCTVTKQPIGTRFYALLHDFSLSLSHILVLILHPQLSSLSVVLSIYLPLAPSQAEHEVYDTVLLAFGNSLPAITLVVRSVGCHI